MMTKGSQENKMTHLNELWEIKCTTCDNAVTPCYCAFLG